MYTKRKTKCYHAKEGETIRKLYKTIMYFVFLFYLEHNRITLSNT